MNASRPMLTRSGDIHHRSVRSVRCPIRARAEENTPVAGRLTAGALIWWNPLRLGSSEGTHPRAPGVAGRSGPALAADSFVVDVAPELGVVFGVGDRDFLLRMLGAVALQVEFAGIGLEQLDVTEDALCVQGYAAHTGHIAVPCLQRRHAAPQLADQGVQLVEFGCTRHRTSSGCS